MQACFLPFYPPRFIWWIFFLFHFHLHFTMFGGLVDGLVGGGGYLILIFPHLCSHRIFPDFLLCFFDNVYI
ncbi:hypothetical protein BZA05DRAFT_386582 [Tricharina praecox]|uniref:uncharacterized protein n=1 Tax=Tricharina praecox TaxID=43433 RepID=UPI00221F686A|nr:uncharacterized protein BZA05DRAFT_386582 [Tricharina praecox]KAI5856913.1 hypothetical protein BZA05DRAFT_386582 [Tricharina praecox]